MERKAEDMNAQEQAPDILGAEFSHAEFIDGGLAPLLRKVGHLSMNGTSFSAQEAIAMTAADADRLHRLGLLRSSPYNIFLDAALRVWAIEEKTAGRMMPKELAALALQLRTYADALGSNSVQSWLNQDDPYEMTGWKFLSSCVVRILVGKQLVANAADYILNIEDAYQRRQAEEAAMHAARADVRMMSVLLDRIPDIRISEVTMQMCGREQLQQIIALLEERGRMTTDMRAHVFCAAMQNPVSRAFARGMFSVRGSAENMSSYLSHACASSAGAFSDIDAIHALFVRARMEPEELRTTFNSLMFGFSSKITYFEPISTCMAGVSRNASTQDLSPQRIFAIRWVVSRMKLKLGDEAKLLMDTFSHNWFQLCEQGMQESASLLHSLVRFRQPNAKIALERTIRSRCSERDRLRVVKWLFASFSRMDVKQLMINRHTKEAELIRAAAFSNSFRIFEWLLLHVSGMRPQHIHAEVAEHIYTSSCERDYVPMLDALHKGVDYFSSPHAVDALKSVIGNRVKYPNIQAWLASIGK